MSVEFGRGVDLCTDVAVPLQPLNHRVCSGFGSNGEVSGEVDQVRAPREEVLVEVRLHQGQGLIGTLLSSCSFRMVLRFELPSVCRVMQLQLRIEDLFLQLTRLFCTCRRVQATKGMLVRSPHSPRALR